MNKISLRWRITILMGILTLFVAATLTALSIRNATNNFVAPITVAAIASQNAENAQMPGLDGIAVDITPSGLPDEVVYIPAITLDVANAKRSFSWSSGVYMLLVAAASMVVAYYLAGRAMRPISNLNHEINQIDGKTLSKRGSIPQTRDEIENLSVSFNKLLVKLKQEFEREKQFSANVAHELKTPLTTIIACSQVLKMNDEATQEEYRENLDVTIQSARRLSDVAERLLMLCRNNNQITFEAINIEDIFCEIQKEIGLIYSQKNIDIKYDLGADTLYGNRVLLYRAFFNLIENAYKYTEPNGSITIEVSSESGGVAIRIVDTGIGIEAGDLDHIFEPFYRADKSRSRKIAGAGLGLAITKEIFELHGAQVAISSEKNKGTVAEVRFKDFKLEQI